MRSLRRQDDTIRHTLELRSRSHGVGEAIVTMRGDVSETESLLRAAGLSLSSEEICDVDALRAQFAAMREALAAVDLTAVEPATIVVPRHQDRVKS